MCHYAGFRWGGSGAAGTQLAAREHGRRSSPGERLCGLCSLCCVFPLPVSSFLFPLSAVLLNCPYPDPLVSACCFPLSSTHRRGEGRPCGAFVAGRSQTITAGLAPTHMQDLALGLGQPREVHTGPILQLVQVSLDGIPPFRCANCTTQLGVVCKLAEGALNLTTSLTKLLNSTSPSVDP